MGDRNTVVNHGDAETNLAMISNITGHILDTGVGGTLLEWYHLEPWHYKVRWVVPFLAALSFHLYARCPHLVLRGQGERTRETWTSGP